MVIERIGGKLTRVPETTTQDKKLESFKKIKETRQFRDLGGKISKQLDPKKFTGTIKDYERLLNSVDSRVKPFLTVNINSIKEEQRRRIKLLDEDIRASLRSERSKRRRASREEDRLDKISLLAKADAEGARRDEARKLRKRLVKGELLDINKVKAFLSDVEKQAKKRAKGTRFGLSEQRRKLEAQSKIDLNQFVGKKITNQELLDKGLSMQQIAAIGQATLDNRKLDKELAAVKAGKTSPGLLLKQGRINAAQATALVRDFELSNQELNKIRNQNASKIFAKLGEKKFRAVDTTTQIRAFKTGVNQALAKELEKPLPLDSSIDKFNSALRNLEKKKKANQTVLRKGLGTALSKQTLTIENKVRTGQSITPREKEIYLENVAKSLKAQDKAQIDLTKKILKSPGTYINSLIKRSRGGESAPLVKDLLNLSKGIGKGLKEIFVDPITGSFDYGRSLVKRAELKGTSANKILVNDIKKLSTGVKDVAVFVKKNPVASGLIVGAAAEKGLKLGKTEFKKNPAESLGRAIAWFFPGKVIKVGGKAIKFTAKGAVGIGKISNSDKLLKGLKASKSFLKLSPVARAKQRKTLLARAIVENTKFKASGKKLDQVKVNLFNRLKSLPEKTLKTRLDKFPVIKKKLFTPKKVDVTKKLTKTQLRKNLLARDIVDKTKFKSKGKALTTAKKASFNRLSKLTIKELELKLSKLTKVKKAPVKAVKKTKPLSDLQKRKNLLARAIVENTKFKASGKKLDQVKVNLFNRLKSLPEKTLKTRLKKIKPVKKGAKKQIKGRVVLSDLQKRKNLLARAIVENTKFKASGKKLEAAKKSLFNRLSSLPEKDLKLRLAKFKVVPKKPIKPGKVINVKDLNKLKVDNLVEGGVLGVKPKAPVKVIDLTKIDPKKITVDIVASGKVPKGKISKKELVKKLAEESKVKVIDLTKPASVPKKRGGISKRMGKSGRVNLSRGTQIQVQRQVKQIQVLEKKLKSTKKVSDINKIRRNITTLKNQSKKVITTLKLIESRGIAPTGKIIFELAKLIKRLDRLAKGTNVKEISLRKPITKKAQKPITKKAIKPKTGTAQKPILATKPRLKPATATQLRNILIKNFLSSKTTKKIKLPGLNLDSKVPKGTNLSFNFRYRRGGKVITRRVELPLNKTLREAIKLIKKTPARSTELVLVGLTKEKDITRQRLKDFRLRKANSKALLLVEVPKSAVKGLKRK